MKVILKFLILVGLISNSFGSEQVTKTKEVNKVKDEYIGLDVRTSMELKMNPAPGAIHISMWDLDEESVKKIAKDKKIKVFCEAGARAAGAVEKLKSWGYSNAENIGSWREWNELEGPKEKTDK